MGLRSLALSEERGGAGADALTSCIVTEELAAGDADLAAVLSESSRLAHVLFDQCMNDAQRDALLPKFMGGDRYHLAFAGREPGSDTRLGVNYHRPARHRGDGEDHRGEVRQRLHRQRRKRLRRQCAGRRTVRGAGANSGAAGGERAVGAGGCAGPERARP